MLITICSTCSEEATATCPRCGRSFCLQHSCLPQGVCMACEAEYQRRRPGLLTRLIGALALIVLIVGAFAIAVHLLCSFYYASAFNMLSWIVFVGAALVFIIPLAGSRLYEKLRRSQFLAQRLLHLSEDAAAQLEARGPFR